MDISGKIKNFFFGSEKNTIALPSFGRDFLRNGNQRVMSAVHSEVVMSDRDFYTGYSYAAINNRANKVSQLAISYLKTTATKKIQDAAREKDIQIVHPYLDLIDSSTDFTNAAFWYDISTYLDLEGVYYLMAVRTVTPSLVGDIQYFKMLNPYEIRRVRNAETMEIGGYVETRDGMSREIPKEMIIEIRKLNPFNRDQTFSMTDAAKEYQFTMKQASDYTRSSLKNNVSAPGIISTDIIMEEEMFRNFQSRVMSQEKGMPLFGNGAGTINWEPMQIDLDKAALMDINEISRSTLFAVSGVSKTTMGIEESGTTREVSRTQKDKFMEDHIMPQLQLIIDALNQDFKIYYKAQYKTNKYTITIDSPMAADKDAEMKDVEIATAGFELYQSLIDAGYEPALAAKYSQGLITLAELGLPTLKPKVEVTPEEPKPKADKKKTLKEIEDTPDSKKKNKHKSVIDGQYLFNYEPDWYECDDDCEICCSLDVKTAVNELGAVVSEDVSGKEASLLNAVQNAENRMVSSMVNKITKNAFDDEGDIISASDKRDAIDELSMAIAAYYLVLFPIYGNKLMQKRASEFDTVVPFEMNTKVKRIIEDASKSAANSHFNTIADDILKVANEVHQASLEREVTALKAAGAVDNEELYALARKKALEGANQQLIVSAIKKEYQNISQTRAKTIARTEANRAFTQSQYQADIQFLTKAGLMEKAYKKWETRSGNACNYCKSLESMAPVPFTKNFVDLGGEITSTFTRKDGTTVVKKMPISYEALSYGGAHTNCGCRYILIIK
jgi:hypothetical protein